MSGFGGGNPLFLEALINNSEAHKGIKKDICIPFSDWCDSASVQIATGTTPELIALATNVHAIKWDHGDGATHVISAQFPWPGEYAELEDDIVMRILARKKDADEENADLMLQAQVYFFTPGDAALTSLTTPARATLAASNAGADLSSFAVYELDIGARLAAETKRIQAGDIVRIVIGPHETVGATDLDVEAIPLSVRVRQHAALYSRTARGSF